MHDRPVDGSPTLMNAVTSINPATAKSPRRRGVLLVNLGTPASTARSDVRRYLNQFLMDPYVLDLPWLLRRLIVSATILPFRPKASAEAYGKIWDAAGPGTGSPLLHYGQRLTERLAAQVDLPCALAMRYGRPSIDAGVRALVDAGVEDILLVALYPHHADSTRTTTVAAVQRALPEGVGLYALPPFFDWEQYIDAQADIIRRHLPARWDKLLLSYHGLPERHLTSADPTGSHCLKSPDCCSRPSPAHATCYRHQTYRTSTLLAEALGLSDDQYLVTFQSRLGRIPWLRPYTDQTLSELPGQGVAHLVVACPAFVADNLETLEEIGISGREIFTEAGGETFTLVPCLNDDDGWVRALAEWCQTRGSVTAPERLIASSSAITGTSTDAGARLIRVA